MPSYEHVFESFDQDTGTVEIPDDAIGITTGTFGGLAHVHYLVPERTEDHHDRDESAAAGGSQGNDAGEKEAVVVSG